MLTDALQMIRPSRDVRELAVLTEIGRAGIVSQRRLARAASVSATMVNAYVDDLVCRGLLEVTGETNRSYRYHLTGAGAERRDALFAEMSCEVVQLYSRLEESVEARLALLHEAGVRSVVLYGGGDSSDLALRVARRVGLEVLAVVDAEPAWLGRVREGLRVCDPCVVEAAGPDAVVTAPGALLGQGLLAWERAGGRVERL